MRTDIGSFSVLDSSRAIRNRDTRQCTRALCGVYTTSDCWETRDDQGINFTCQVRDQVRDFSEIISTAI